MTKLFKIDSKTIKLINEHFYTSYYFKKSEKIAQTFFKNDIVTMQFSHFHEKPIFVSGISYILSILKSCLKVQEFQLLEIYTAKDGSLVSNQEAVMLIKGPYHIFARFENLFDGILARCSSVSNNCYQLLQIIKPEELIYMADRSDYFLNQPLDGYAAYLAGVRNFSTNACVSLINELFKNNEAKVIGTIPHAIIQLHDGDLNKTIRSYEKLFKKCKVALVDYHNDVKNEIIELSKQFSRIEAIRIDTSSNLIDQSLNQNDPKNKGVSLALVKLARKTLDECGMKNTKIIISSSLNLEKIKYFKNKKAPIDVYGVGNALINRNLSFTADLVQKNDKKEAKAGRKIFKK